jgi:hypothetical protein
LLDPVAPRLLYEPFGLSANAFVRQQLDRLGLGQKLTEFQWGGKTVRLPLSSLAA